ncbi:MAG: DUF882 domain-containing protein [Desulfatiglandaceae bacterium]
MDCDRRRFIKIGAGAALGVLFPASAFAAFNRSQPCERTLHFYNTHTGESLETCYYRRGRYQADALKKIDYILRDHYSGKIRPIHRELLDLLSSIALTIGKPTRFHIISGYRSPKTNAMLCKKSRGVARHSLHMEGKAIDIRVCGYDTKRLRTTCMEQQAGGVGYYPKSDFVHVDVGRVRYW